MKTPIPSAARFRALFVSIVLFASSIIPAGAEWITIQIPLTMVNRSFKFWEEGSTGAETFLLEAPADQMGYVLGDYSRSLSGVPVMMGGSIGQNGSWYPDGSSYATISAFRQGTGMFFLEDETTNQLSPPNQTGLLYADWRTRDVTAPLRFMSFPESRHAHLLAFVYGSGGGIILTKGAVQKAIGDDGQEYYQGFFKAWATGIDPLQYGTPSNFSDGKIVDFTAQEAAWTSINSSFIESSIWWPDTTPHSLQNLYLEFAYSEQGRQFDVYAGGSITRVTASSGGTAEGGAVLIGAGIEFRVVRVNSVGEQDGATGSHQMPLSSLNFNVSAELPPSASDPVFATVHFRISASLNPWGFQVENNGNYLPLQVSEWENTVTVSYPGTNTPVTISYRDAWVNVNASMSYSVYDSGNNNIGQGPDFFEYPPAGTIASEVLSASIPVARKDHGMRTGENFDGTWSATVGLAQSFDPWVAGNYSYQVASLSVPFSPNFLASGVSVELTDLDTGEVSQEGSLEPSGILGFESWHVSQPLILKISGTRWNNALQIRCADGTVYPVTRHRIQGDWSVDPGTGLPWFNPYGFFDATATSRAGIPWHLYDLTRGQYLTADGSGPASFINATDNMNSDADSLPDWYERLIGTNPNVADTDGDGTNDAVEVAAGTNPLARPVTAPGATLKVFTRLEP